MSDSKKGNKVGRFLSNAANNFNIPVSLARSLGSILSDPLKISTKHDFEYDFGYKELVVFDDLYQMYKRNSAANSLVVKTTSKTWETMPKLRSSEERAEEMKETTEEKTIRRRFERIRFWQMLAETDHRSMVGEYAGVVFQLGDGKKFSEPVDTVPGGIDGLLNLIPAWEGQLEITQWDQDEESQTYGEPQMMTYTESNVDSDRGKTRSFQVHPDRVYIWSKDRTTFNDSQMEAVFNALLDMTKIRGAGGEGFWKNAKSQPVIEFNENVNLQELKQALGVENESEIADRLDEVVENWNRGFDQSLMIQGGKVTSLNTDLPQPKQYYEIAAREVAATWGIPEKVWFGNQTGERSSTEDANTWNKHNMSRRYNYVIPNIMDVLDRMVRFGVLMDNEWSLYWEDLSAATEHERMESASKMSRINQEQGEKIFTSKEIRRKTGRIELPRAEEGQPLLSAVQTQPEGTTEPGADAEEGIEDVSQEQA